MYCVCDFTPQNKRTQKINGLWLVTGVFALVQGFKCCWQTVCATLLRSVHTQGKKNSLCLGKYIEREGILQMQEWLNVEKHRWIEKLSIYPWLNLSLQSVQPPHLLFHTPLVLLFSLSLQVFFTPLFCKFSFLTLCQVEGRGHPGVNCSARDGWRKAESNFHTFLSRVHRHCCLAL